MTHTTETGGQQIGVELLGNSKPSGRIIMIGQPETRSSSSQIIFITLFSVVHTIAVSFTSHRKL